MALNVTFADFDTACYNLQYNVIQLVKHCVGIVVEVNANGAKLDSLDQQVGILLDTSLAMLEDMEKLVPAMAEMQQTIIPDIYSRIGGDEARITQLKYEIDQLDERVTALGG